jgi:hypothetical protein
MLQSQLKVVRRVALVLARAEHVPAKGNCAGVTAVLLCASVQVGLAHVRCARAHQSRHR